MISLVVPSLAQTIQNPKNLIIEEANDKFVRGGIASRQLIRDKNYLKEVTLFLGKNANK